MYIILGYLCGCAHVTLGEIAKSNMADNFEKCYNFSTSSVRKMILMSRYRLLCTRNPIEEETLSFDHLLCHINPRW